MNKQHPPEIYIRVEYCHERLNTQFAKGDLVRIAQQDFCIGRSDQCDLYINDEESEISRTHAHVVYQMDGYYIFDDSINGTWINGEKIKRGEKNKLSHGDLIGIASAIHFTCEDPRRTRNFFSTNPYIASGFSINDKTRQVIIRYRAVEKPLADVDFNFLAYLFQNHDRPVPKQELAKVVWNAHYDVTFDTVISSAAHRVRQRLKEADPEGHDYIKNLRGLGYRLDLPGS